MAHRILVVKLENLVQQIKQQHEKSKRRESWNVTKGQFILKESFSTSIRIVSGHYSVSSDHYNLEKKRIPKL